MAYQTYITEAIVCGSIDSNTSNRSYYLFTREAGMVFAHAQSVREERSKHRYALQICSHVRVTLVRGKGGWRITGAEPLYNFYSHAKTREARACVRNVIILIRRVIQGETAHGSIFDEVIFACTHVGHYSPTQLETVLVLRILNTLGYIAYEKIYSDLIEQPLSELSIDTLDKETEKRCRICIDNALKESHL